jgi:hypothetical protein
MNTNFILTKDNFFTENECTEIINYFKDKTKKPENNYLNYLQSDIEQSPYMFSVSTKILSYIDEYKQLYPESNETSSYWGFTNMRFKHFMPGKNFDSWHSEHSFYYPYRMLSIMIYLSNHNCGTEFYNGDIIKSKAGRLTIFPAYFTHTHRGQVCPENKDRYLLTGYFNFVRQGENETKTE